MAGSPSSVSTTLRSQAVTVRVGPLGWQPCVTREISATSRLKATPDRPPRQTPPAMCTAGPREAARPPNR